MGGATTTATALACTVDAFLAVATIRVVLTLPLWQAAGVVQAARARRLCGAIRIDLAIDAAADRASLRDIALTGATTIIAAGTRR